MLGPMSLIDALLDRWAGTRLIRSAEKQGINVLPPRRPEAGTILTPEKAVTVPAVYRAAQILATAAAQLPLTVERNGQTLPRGEVPALIRRPNVDMSRSDFIEQVILSLVLHGNAYLLKHQSAGDVVSLDVLNPAHVYVEQDPETRRVKYHYQGRAYTASQVQHLRLLPIPGHVLGFGPIQAAQASATTVLEMRDYMSRWFTETGQPNGILTSDQVLSAADASLHRNAWNGLDAEGEPLDRAANPTGIRVLGKGLTYSPILISPKDALWLDAQSWSVLEVARVFGVPSSLMLAALEGNSQTYSNVEQDWLAFVRFTLLGYLRKIEEALTDFTVRGQTVRFNIEGLLRSDTKTRYEAHKTALEAGFMTVNEVRQIEGMTPLNDPEADTAKARAPQLSLTQETPA